jgi:hypothetical protein
MLNPRPGFRLYPRGFLGALPVPKLEKMVKETTLSVHSGQIHLNVFNPRDPEMSANDDIERLYGDYIKENGDVLAFDFRKQILFEALNAFGTHSFFHWMREQVASPSFGEMHQRFLVDTLNYLSGKRREMSLLTWEALVDIEDPAQISRQYRDTVEEFFGVSLREQQAKRNDTVVDVIQLWCGRPGGIEDLLQTLHLLFGNT